MAALRIVRSNFPLALLFFPDLESGWISVYKAFRDALPGRVAEDRICMGVHAWVYLATGTFHKSI